MIICASITDKISRLYSQTQKLIYLSHWKQFGNKGKYFTSYLSFNILEQFITVITDQVLTVIFKEIQNAKYFSIIVDSMLDVSRVDQLSFVVRYVKNNGTPIKRFMWFLPNSGHKSEELTVEVMTTLFLYDLDPAFLHAQSYDNASNMAGAYSGLQSRIKKINFCSLYCSFLKFNWDMCS